MRKLLVLLTALFTLFAASGAALAKDYSTSEYIKIFKSGSADEQSRAAKSLEWAGISDPRIFDLMEKNLLAGYKTADSRSTVGHMSWLTKGLSFSGQEKYRATIEEVAANGGHKKLRKYASTSLEMLPKYKRWNAILSGSKGNKKGKSKEINKLVRMLRSDEHELNYAAAHEIYEKGMNDAYLLDTLKQATERRIAEDASSREYVDAAAWMLRALGATRQEKHLAVLENAAENAKHKKVRKYAKKYLKQYSK